jgi:50S ribosomal protein 5
MIVQVLTTESPLEVKETAKDSDSADGDASSVGGLKLESEADILKKKQKRAELRRKRLVRKRHLRKKGRWPPSKMAKLKNV